MSPLTVVGFAGSLRKASLNRALLRAAAELAPPTLRIEVHDLLDVPLYNEDVEAQGTPAGVERLRTAIRAADALLIATPEYNHGVPGVTKNAVDWLSRPPRQSVLDAKPCAVMGASPGSTGTARGQSQLRQAFEFTNTPAMLQPELLVARAHQKFDAEGRLTDEETRTYLQRFLGKFEAFVRAHQAGRS